MAHIHCAESVRPRKSRSLLALYKSLHPPDQMMVRKARVNSLGQFVIILGWPSASTLF